MMLATERFILFIDFLWLQLSPRPCSVVRLFCRQPLNAPRNQHYRSNMKAELSDSLSTQAGDIHQLEILSNSCLYNLELAADILLFFTVLYSAFLCIKLPTTMMIYHMLR